MSQGFTRNFWLSLISSRGSCRAVPLQICTWGDAQSELTDGAKRSRRIDEIAHGHGQPCRAGRRSGATLEERPRGHDQPLLLISCWYGEGGLAGAADRGHQQVRALQECRRKIPLVGYWLGCETRTGIA